MALVAYSDESDMSDDDEDVPSSPVTSKILITNSSTANPSKGSDKSDENKPNGIKKNMHIESNASSRSFICSEENKRVSLCNSGGIDNIVDDDDFIIPGANNIISRPKLRSNLSAISQLTIKPKQPRQLSMAAHDDDLSDVHTKDTWKITKDVLEKRESTSSKAGSSSTPKTMSFKSSSSSAGIKTAASTLGKAAQAMLASSALGDLIKTMTIPGGKMQLVLPALAEFEEEEEDNLEEVERKKVAPSSIGTGLFALLPKPKQPNKGKETKRSLVPHILSKPRKPAPKHVPRSMPNSLPNNSKLKKTKMSILGEYEDSDEEDEDSDKSSGSDFFSLDSKVEVSPDILVAGSSLIVNEITDPPIKYSHLNYDHKSSDNIVNLIPEETKYNIDISVSGAMYEDQSEGVSDNDTASLHHSPTTADTDGFISVRPIEPIDATQMDDDTWRRLTGKKRKAEHLEIIDVNADDALLTREEWMNRAASQEKPTVSHSKKKGNLPSQQQKKKHQITYLAHQAKEREVELKNEWSAGKLKKQQTRAKYGF